jgi:hypothetical protein
MRSYEPELRSRARQYGLAAADEPDVWKLARAVHNYEDELRRPELERRAKELGLPTRWRSVTDLSLAIYDEEQRRRLQADYDHLEGGR